MPTNPASDDLDRLFAHDLAPAVNASVDAATRGLVGQATVVCACGTPKKHDRDGYFCPACDAPLC